jgi:hypothetical protein
VRPVILGMCNPNGGEPWEDGVTTRRLVSMIGRECFESFDLDNVLRQERWSKIEARRRKTSIREKLRGRTVVVLGNEVWQALSLPKASWFCMATTADGTRWWRVPHPSGRSTTYNDREKIEFLAELMERVVADA